MGSGARAEGSCHQALQQMLLAPGPRGLTTDEDVLSDRVHWVRVLSGVFSFLSGASRWRLLQTGTWRDCTQGHRALSGTRRQCKWEERLFGDLRVTVASC